MQLLKLAHSCWQRTPKLVVDQIQDLEALAVADLGWNSRDSSVGNVKADESFDVAELARNGACEGVPGQNERGGDWAGECNSSEPLWNAAGEFVVPQVYCFEILQQGELLGAEGSQAIVDDG